MNTSRAGQAADETTSTLGELATRLGATLESPDANAAARVVRGVASLHEATAEEVSFFAHPRYREQLATTQAAALIVGGAEGAASVAAELRPELPRLRVPRPYVALAEVLGVFHPAWNARPAVGVDPRAAVAASARLGRDVSVGPFVFVGEGAELGDGVVLEPGVYVGEGARIGAGSWVRARASVRARCVLGERVLVHDGAVIGADGYGFAWDGTRHAKIPQVGVVIVEDDVEIGANACIDRATFGATRVGAGSKLDNLVQVGHNTQLGRHVLLVAQVGVAGSVTVGDGAALGGQVGVAGHNTIGARARIAAQSGVGSDVPAGEEWGGSPAVPAAEWLRNFAASRRARDTRSELRELQRELTRLGAELDALRSGNRVAPPTLGTASVTGDALAAQATEAAR